MIFVLNVYCLYVIWYTICHFTYDIDPFIWNNFLLMFNTFVITHFSNRIVQLRMNIWRRVRLFAKYFFQIVIYVHMPECIITWEKFLQYKIYLFAFLIALLILRLLLQRLLYFLLFLLQQDWSESPFVLLFISTETKKKRVIFFDHSAVM